MNLKKIFQLIFSIQNKCVHKQICLLGFKFKIFNQKKVLVDIMANQSDKFEELKSCIVASKINKSFEKYRGIYSGHDIVIVGCGPSLKYYKPIENAIHVGINRAFKFEKINFDYLFASDRFPEGMEDFINYLPNTCTKIIAYKTTSVNFKPYNSDLLKMKHEALVINGNPNSRLPYDLVQEPIGAYLFASTVMFALQWALFTNPQRIFIVGCDATGLVNMYREKPDKLSGLQELGGYEYQLQGWNLIKEDMRFCYPQIEIVSVNPVGLKGYFNDIYTENFLKAQVVC